MKLVLLFFCGILGIFIFIILLLLLSTIKLNISKLNIKNFENGVKFKKIKKDFEIYLELCLFGKIKYAKIKIDKKKIQKLKIKNSFKDIKKDAEILKNIKIGEIVKKLKVDIEKLNLSLELGTEEITLTVFLVTIISTLLGIALHNQNKENIDFNIVPLYQFGNSVNLKLNCIIDVKIVHIIYVIYILLKKGMIKNERTSNRRSYDYSYE